MVQGWFQAAGLKAIAAEAIAPHAGSKEKLTVKLWLARNDAKTRAEAA